MTEAEERIEQLKAPPLNVRTRADTIERVVAWLAGVVSIVALTLGVVSVERISNQAACINSNLGARQGPAQVQRKAELTWTTSILAAFDPTSGTPVERGMALQIATQAFQLALQTAVNQAAENPLGKC